MTKDELKEAIIARGGTFDARINKAGLEDIYYELYPDGNDRLQPVSTKEIPIEKKLKVADDGTPVLDENGNPVFEETLPDGKAGKPEVGEDNFDELLGKISGAEIPTNEKKREKALFESSRQRTKRGKSSPDQTRIEGYMLLLVIDTVYPSAFAFLNNMLDKKMKVQAHQLSLKPEQWKALEPLADQAADYLAININPIAAFMLMSTFMYGNNLISVRMQISTEAK
jgi:hypothetical protein